MIHRVNMARDGRKSFVPCDGDVFISGSIVTHWLGQPTLFLKPKIGLSQQFGHGMALEEGARYPFVCYFPSDCLGAVFAEFEGRSMFRIWPGATRTIEPLRLVRGQQRLAAARHNALPA